MASQIKLSFKFALREMRAGLKGFRIFIACLALGVGTIAGVGSLSQAIKGGLERDARFLLGGDVALRLTHRPVSLKQKAFIARNNTLSESIEMRAMAHKIGGQRRSLVELKGVDSVYPLVGEIKFNGAGNLTTALSKIDTRWGAIVEKRVLRKLGLKVGDFLKLGEAEFIITGTITKEPDRIASFFSLGPRIMVSIDSLPKTELIQPGSQIHYHYRVVLGTSKSVKNKKKILNHFLF